MRVTKRKLWNERVRDKIRASYLINRLMNHIEGKVELSMSQVRAIEILLRKSVPDLARVEVKTDAIYRYVAEIPPVLSREEWLQKYGSNHLSPPAALQ